MDNPRDKAVESQIATLNECLEQRLAERTVELRKKTDRLRAMASELMQVEQREHDQR